MSKRTTEVRANREWEGDREWKGGAEEPVSKETGKKDDKLEKSEGVSE